MAIAGGGIDDSISGFDMLAEKKLQDVDRAGRKHVKKVGGG